MKRIFTMVLCMLILFSVSALGEGIDLSSLTLDELVALRESVNIEIDNRIGIIDSQIGTGQYVVGENLKAGKYEFVCTFVNVMPSVSGGTGLNQSRLVVLTNLDEDGEKLCDYYNILIDQQYKIDLEDGNVLLIRDANFIVTPYSLSFAP